jgi:hypothetical protein
MRAALLSLTKHLCAAETIPPRVNWPKALAAVVAPHIAALVTIGWIERNAFALGLALLTWCFLNGVWLALLRRPALAAALSLIMIEALIVLSQFKINIQQMSVSFFDFLVVDADTISFLLMIFPVLRMGLIVGALVAAPLLVLLWRLDPFRLPRRSAMTLTMASLAGIIGLASAVPEHPWERFENVNYISNFTRSGVLSISALISHGWLETDGAMADPLATPPAAACEPEPRPPHIIMLLDESSFDITAAPGIKVPSGYRDHFRSYDGKQRSFLTEAHGGPTWYAEYNVLTGLSARSYGRFMFYVTRIAAGRVMRGLPASLSRCGYDTFTLYPAYGDFLSARRFQQGVGIRHFVDLKGMGVTSDMQPDKFFFDQALRTIESEHRKAPLFLFAYVAVNHFPWDWTFRPDLSPDWRPLGNDPEVDEYIRRQTMSARDYAEFLARLRRDFPTESFLLVRFGDHQPAISIKVLDPHQPFATIVERVMNYDPRYFTTYYAIDAVNFTPIDVASAVDTLEAAYLPLIVLEAAGLPLDPSFAEQKKILRRCNGLFHACAGGAEARRFNRMLIDAGLIKNL